MTLECLSACGYRCPSVSLHLPFSPYYFPCLCRLMAICVSISQCPHNLRILKVSASQHSPLSSLSLSLFALFSLSQCTTVLSLAIELSRDNFAVFVSPSLKSLSPSEPSRCATGCSPRQLLFSSLLVRVPLASLSSLSLSSLSSLSYTLHFSVSSFSSHLRHSDTTLACLNRSAITRSSFWSCCTRP